jgi:hypothetical protein
MSMRQPPNAHSISRAREQLRCSYTHIHSCFRCSWVDTFVIIEHIRPFCHGVEYARGWLENVAGEKGFESDNGDVNCHIVWELRGVCESLICL